MTLLLENIDPFFSASADWKNMDQKEKIPPFRFLKGHLFIPSPIQK